MVTPPRPSSRRRAQDLRPRVTAVFLPGHADVARAITRPAGPRWLP
ncbi:hypothetical protein Ae505Ps2_0720 [Pseudonocardia sp. Ae505_Ps2]|nr:hypothetical protein Ae331Ps2_1377 [Pseudonocardia sp. Ae331_Ps2]OLM10597.1 hypothetical protein Ae505Ps2_0720 [Pseudonocardia sp. Ae505_Ps2]